MANTITGLVIGITIGALGMGYAYERDMKDAGIKRIERCHNASSNWCEVVWADKAK